MSVVSRERVPTAVLVLVAVLAVSAAAATIDTTVGTGGFGTPETPEPPDPPGDVDPPGENPPDTGNGDLFGNSGASLDLSVCIAALRTPLAIAGILGGLGLLFGGLYRRYGGSTTLLAGSAVTPLVTGAYFFLTNCDSGFGGNTGPGGGPGLPPGGTGVQAPAISPAVLGVVLLGVLGAAAVTVYAVTGRDEEFAPVEEAEDLNEPDATDFAEAAGRAADRIEQANVPVDNAVYRAWLEMTTMLDIENPETATPKDFADEAIAFGLDAADVRELRELFTEVRYGHRDPESRADRAVAILRSFEAEYGDDLRDVGGSERP